MTWEWIILILGILTIGAATLVGLMRIAVEAQIAKGMNGEYGSQTKRGRDV